MKFKRQSSPLVSELVPNKSIFIMLKIYEICFQNLCVINTGKLFTFRIENLCQFNRCGLCEVSVLVRSLFYVIYHTLAIINLLNVVFISRSEEIFI